MNPFLSPQGQVPGEMLAYGAPANNAGVPMQTIAGRPPMMPPMSPAMSPKMAQAPAPQILPQASAAPAPSPQPAAPAAGGGQMSPGRTALIRSVMAKTGAPRGRMGNYKPPAGGGRPMAPPARPRPSTPMFKPPGG